MECCTGSIYTRCDVTAVAAEGLLGNEVLRDPLLGSKPFSLYARQETDIVSSDMLVLGTGFAMDIRCRTEI